MTGENKNSRKILWITRTAIFIAILVVVQFVTAQFGTTLLTGSLVNLILILSVMTCGLPTGAAVAVLSPIFAKLIGIGPFWTIIPFLILGNLVLIVIWHFIGGSEKPNRYAAWVIALVISAIVKFGIIYFGVVKLAIPLILGLPENPAAIMSAAFSLPQLLTASIGGMLAIILLPVLKKALSRWV